MKSITLPSIKWQPITWQPKKSVKALFDQIMEVKFSTHTTLFFVLLSIFWTVYRTRHWLTEVFHLPNVVAWPTAAFQEGLVVAAAASVFVSLRFQFVDELRGGKDARFAKMGVILSGLGLIAAFIALVTIAGSDASRMTKEFLPAFVMILVQVAQMFFIVIFITQAILDEREKLRLSFAEIAKAEAEAEEEKKRIEADQAEAKRKADKEAADEARRIAAGTCPYCMRAVLPNNRSRHMRACTFNPEKQGGNV